MNELQLINKCGVFYADSRQVAEMIGKDHAMLLRDIRRYVNVLTNANLQALDFFVKATYTDSKGESRPRYLISRKGCDMVANKMTGDKGILFTAEYVTRFDEMEKELTKPKFTLPDFTNPVEAARAWADEVEAKQKAQAQIEADKPKVLFADSVSASKNSVSVAEMAKILKQNGVDTGQNRFYQYLRDNNYLVSRKGLDYNCPTQYAMNLGLFEIQKTVINTNHGIETKKTPRVTGKGQLYFVDKFRKVFLNENQRGKVVALDRLCQ